MRTAERVATKGKLRANLRSEVRPALAGNAARDDIQAEVCGVFIRGQLKAQAVEVGQGSCAGALENRTARLTQQQDLIKEDEDAIARLVDDRNDRHSQISHPATKVMLIFSTSPPQRVCLTPGMLPIFGCSACQVA